MKDIRNNPLHLPTAVLTNRTRSITLPAKMTKRLVIIEALTSTPAEIRRVIRPLAMRASDIYFEQVHHASLTILLKVLKNEIKYQNIMQQCVGPKLIQTSEELDLNLEGNAPLIKVFDSFCFARGETLELLRSMEAKDWQRKVRHSANSITSVRFLAQGLVENDIKQTSQLVELLQALRHRSEYPIES